MRVFFLDFFYSDPSFRIAEAASEANQGQDASCASEEFLGGDRAIEEEDAPPPPAASGSYVNSNTKNTHTKTKKK
jgi:hypothetical protein